MVEQRRFYDKSGIRIGCPGVSVPSANGDLIHPRGLRRSISAFTPFPTDHAGTRSQLHGNACSQPVKNDVVLDASGRSFLRPNSISAAFSSAMTQSSDQVSGRSEQWMARSKAPTTVWNLDDSGVFIRAEPSYPYPTARVPFELPWPPSPPSRDPCLHAAESEMQRACHLDHLGTPCHEGGVDPSPPPPQPAEPDYRRDLSSNQLSARARIRSHRLHARGRHAPALVSAGPTGPFHMRLSRGLCCSCPYQSACLSRMRMLSVSRYMVAVVQWPMLLPAHRLEARRVCEAPTRVKAASVRYMSHGGAARSAQASMVKVVPPRLLRYPIASHCRCCSRMSRTC